MEENKKKFTFSSLREILLLWVLISVLTFIISIIHIFYFVFSPILIISLGNKIYKSEIKTIVSTLKSSFKSVIAKDEVLKQSLDCELLKLITDCFVSSFLAMTCCFVLVQKGFFKVNSLLLTLFLYISIHLSYLY